jgi:hypothetical protein
MLRTLFAGAVACAIVPAIALLRYLGAADQASALPALQFAVLLVLPCFGVVALLGLPLARMQSVPLKTWAFLGLGVLAALAAWGTALLTHDQLRPNAGRLLSHLLLDGLLCFAIYWYLAVGRSSKLRTTAEGETKIK